MKNLWKSNQKLFAGWELVPTFQHQNYKKEIIRIKNLGNKLLPKLKAINVRDTLQIYALLSSRNKQLYELK